MEVASHFCNAYCKPCSGNSPDITLQTLDQFKQDLIQLLGDNLFEIIIHGSFALDVFRRNLGDLDYMVVTNENLDDSMNASAGMILREFRASDCYLKKKCLSNSRGPLSTTSRQADTTSLL